MTQAATRGWGEGCSPQQLSTCSQPSAPWHGLAVQEKQGRTVKPRQALAADVFQVRLNVSTCLIADESRSPPLPLPWEAQGAAPNEMLTCSYSWCSQCHRGKPGQKQLFLFALSAAHSSVDPQPSGFAVTSAVPWGLQAARRVSVGEQHGAGQCQCGAMGRNEIPAAALSPVRLKRRLQIL